MNSRRTGFTVLELIVALAVGGTAILGAAAVLGNVADQAERLTDEARASDAQANGERLLRALAASYVSGFDGGIAFAGERTAATFVSWCHVPDGWQERCRVRLVLRAGPSADSFSALVAELSSGSSEVLLSGLPGAGAVELRYLDDPAGGGRWFHTWGAGVSAPIAIGVVTATDTLIVRLGTGP